jgi:beta-phosphoglucomutase-like phosphatase (HAD superfamily)
MLEDLKELKKDMAKSEKMENEKREEELRKEKEKKLKDGVESFIEQAGIKKI